MYILESVLLYISTCNAKRIEQQNYFQGKTNSEGKVATAHDMEVYGILHAKLQSCLISVVIAVSSELQALAASPEGIFSQYLPDRRLGVPQGWSVRFGEEKSISLQARIEQ